MNTIHDEVEALLRRTRQRYTAGRRELVSHLVTLAGPATLGDLVDRGIGQSQSSLYRNLAVLEQCGAVRRVSSVDDVNRFELTETLTEHHHHLVCQQCGRIDDVTLPPQLESSLHRAGGHIDTKGFSVDGHRVELFGTCPECA